MSEKHLGLPFDIHGGGADLKFPHHENEIAQSCCAHGIDDDLAGYAKYWVHNGFVTVEGEKMSKSLGNVTLVHDLVESHEGAVLRLALLMAHYRQPLDWGAQVIHQAQKLYEKIQNVLFALKNVEAAEGDGVDPAILEALCDDLNTPKAFAALNDLIGRINKASEEDLPNLKLILHNSISLIGVAVVASEGVEVDFDVLLEERAQAKAEKNWARADAIRDEIAAQGYEIIDTPEGAKVKKL